MRYLLRILPIIILLGLLLPVNPITLVYADSDTFYSSYSDGQILKYDAVYATAHDASTGTVYDATTTIQVGQNYTGSYYIHRSFLFFDTSSIPDGAQIDSATLSLYGETDLSNVDFNLLVMSGAPTYPHDPLVAGDYLYSQYSGTGNNAWNSSSFTVGAYNNITLNATGKGWINKTGLTKLALRSEEDVNSSPPTVIELLLFYSANNPQSKAPKLTVTYSASSTPTITTNDATYVTAETARLNAYLDNDGGGECEIRFQYYITATGSWTDNETVWVEGFESEDSTYVDISGLTPSTGYTFRAQAKNSQGSTSASSRTLTTEAGASTPSNLWGDPSFNSIALSWTKGPGANLSVLRYKEGEYPTDETDGTLIYNGMGGNYTHEGLDSGTTYYYRVWGLTGSTYSASYSEVMITTPAGAGVGAYNVPSSPGNWFLSPDPSGISGIPGYTLVNNLADSYGIPQSTFWLGIAFFLILAFGLISYKMSENLLVAVMVVVISMATFTTMRLVPGYMAGLFFITAIGIGFVGRKV